MSPFSENGKVWMNGKLIPWREANIHIASHVIHYGSSLFEGFRPLQEPSPISSSPRGLGLFVGH